MAKTQRAQVVITCNSSLAKKALDEIKTHAAQLRQQYNQMAKDYDKVVAEQGKGSKAARDMNRELKRLETTSKALDKAIKVNEQDLGDVSRIMKNLSGATTRQLRQALSALKRQMENTSGSETARLRQLQSQMKAVQAQIERNTGAVRRHGSAWQTSIRNIGTYIGMFAGLHQAIAKVQSVFSGNLEMSDKLSEIRMVSGLTMQNVKGLSRELQGLDTRTKLGDLQQIAYEGSKLGMGEYGVEGLKGFTEAMNQVNVALKEQLGEDTMPALAKMTENMGDIKKMGVEQALLSTSSAIFKLAATSTASAGPIVEFSKRMYGLARASRMATPDLLAFASASDAIGENPEVGATAMNKMLVAIQKSPHAVEDAFGMKRDTIQNLFNAGHITEAFVDIFKRLKEMGSLNAQAPLMKILGSDGSRLVRWVVGMSQNVDVLEKHLQTSNQAFEQGTAVTEEYNLRQETAQGMLERANNLWSKAFVNDEGVDFMKNLTTQWYELSKAMTSSTFVMGQLKSALFVLVGAMKLLMVIGPSVLQILATIGIARGIAALPGLYNSAKTAIVGFYTTYSAGIRAHYAEKDALRLADQQKEMASLQAMTAFYSAYYANQEARQTEQDAIDSRINAMSTSRYRALSKAREAVDQEYTAIYNSLTQARIAAGDDEYVARVNSMALDRVAIAVAEGKITQQQANLVLTDLQTKALAEYAAWQNGANEADIIAAGNAALKAETKTADATATTADTVATGENTAANIGNATSAEASAAGAASDAAAKGVETAATNDATVATQRLNAAQKANIWGIIIGLILLAAQAVYSFVSSLKENDSVQQKLNDSMQKYNGDLEVERQKLDAAKAALDATTRGTEARRIAIKNFNSQFGSYLTNMLTEKSTAQDIAKAYEEVNKQLAQKMAYEGMQEDMKNILVPKQRLYGVRMANYVALGGSREFAEQQMKAESGMNARQALNAYLRAAGLKLTAAQINNVLGYANQNTITHGVEHVTYNNTSAGATTTVTYEPLTLAEKQAHAYISARQAGGSMSNTQNRIVNQWQPLVGNYVQEVGNAAVEGVTPVTFTDSGSGKSGTGKNGRTGTDKNGNSPAEQLEVERKKIDGLISNIEAYYNNQEAAIEDMVSQGSLSRAKADNFLTEMKKKREQALMQARLAIAGEDNHWEYFKKNEMGMGKDLVDIGRLSEELSRSLLDDIVGANVDNIKTVLENLDGGRAILRDVVKKATENNYNFDKIVAEQRQKAMQALYQYDYTKNYLDDVESQMIGFGFAESKDDSFFKAPPKPATTPEDNYYIDENGKKQKVTMSNASENNPVNLDEVTVMGNNSYLSPYQAMMKQYIANSPDYLKFNPNNDLDLYKFLNAFASNGNVGSDGEALSLTKWAQNFSKMTNKDKTGWLDILGTMGYDATDADDMATLKEKMDPIRDQVKAFFNYLFDADGRYYTDVVEKQQQRSRKIIASRWEHSTDYMVSDQNTKELNRRIANERIYGRPQNDWQPFGFSKTIRSDDSEMALRTQNVSDAQKQLELAQQQTADPKVLADYVKKVDDAINTLETLVAKRVTDRMAELKQWTDPIEELGTKLGEAFAQMGEDAKAGRDAVKEALKDMVSSYGKAMIDIINQELMRSVKTALIQKEDRERAKKYGANVSGNNNNVNALFNNNGKPTGTIDSANIVISNANVNGQPANGVGQQVDANGNPIAPGTIPTTDANGNPINPNNPNGAVNPANPNGAPASSVNPQQQGANTAENVVTGTVENGFDITSSIGTAATDVLGNTMGDIGNSIQEQLAQRREKSNDKTNQKAEKKAKTHAKNMEKINKDSSKNIESDQKNSNKTTLQAQDALQTGIQSSTNQMSQAVQKSATEQQKANTDTVSQNAKTDTEGGIVSGAGKIIARLGWWGIPLVAVITALLNGLLSAFLSKLGKGGSSESKAPNTKLKTGMLTYDSGNVQQYRGLLDGKSYPVVGTDGNVYAATSVPEAVTGIVNSPIATMINGQPSVVAEKGPEIVIGRQTTAAMMMNRPDLLKEIIEYDRNRSGMTYRAYDSGNVQQLTQQGALPDGTSAMDMSQMQETLSTLTIAVAGLTSRLKEPIYAQMNPYGRGGAVDVMKKANDFLAKHK